MTKRLVIKRIKHCRNRRSVISPESRPSCSQPAVLHIQFKSLRLKIMLCSGIFFTYHVGMSLKHNARLCLIARRCRLSDKNIIQAVSQTKQASVRRKLLYIIGNIFFISRTAGDGAYILKIMKQSLRSITFYNIFSHKQFSFEDFSFFVLSILVLIPFFRIVFSVNIFVKLFLRHNRLRKIRNHGHCPFIVGKRNIISVKLCQFSYTDNDTRSERAVSVIFYSRFIKNVFNRL